MLRCGIVGRHRTVRRKLRFCVAVVQRLRGIHDLIKGTIGHQNVPIKQPDRCFAGKLRQIQIKGNVLLPIHVPIPIPAGRTLIKIFARKKQADFTADNGDHRIAGVDLIGI